MTKYFVANLLNKDKSEIVPCVCYEFPDTKGYFEVFELKTLNHFRRELGFETSELTAISGELFNSLRDIPHTFL